jgi:uncharacterized protein YecE (DUF72 family)
MHLSDPLRPTADKRETKVGCCGYPVSREEYYKHFNCIEINITFYQLPEIKTALKWEEEAPENFEFILKAWQLITHPANSFTYRRLKEKIPDKKKKNYGFFQPTDEVFRAWTRTKEFADALGCKKILFQCPRSFKPTLENKKNIKKFFHLITQPARRSLSVGGSPNHQFTFIWEPRGEWAKEEIKEICRRLNLIHCVDPTIKNPLYGEFNYFRLHGSYLGGRINYNYQFNDQELNKVFKMCTKPLNYVMFNNSTMFADALKFKKLVKVE